MFMPKMYVFLKRDWIDFFTSVVFSLPYDSAEITRVGQSLCLCCGELVCFCENTRYNTRSVCDSNSIKNMCFLHKVQLNSDSAVGHKRMNRLVRWTRAADKWYHVHRCTEKHAISPGNFATMIKKRVLLEAGEGSGIFPDAGNSM